MRTVEETVLTAINGEAVESVEMAVTEVEEEQVEEVESTEATDPMACEMGCELPPMTDNKGYLSL